MKPDSDIFNIVELLSVRKPAFEASLRKKVVTTLLALPLKQARDIAKAGAAPYFDRIIDGLPIPGLLKIARKFDPHLTGRDAMPDSWLRSHVKKLVAGTVEPVKPAPTPRKPRPVSDKAPATPKTRRNTPERVRVVVNG